jgi:hypothetical protein
MLLNLFYKACTSILIVNIIYENRLILKKVFINILYNGIHLYSRCQIYLIPKLRCLYELYNSYTNTNTNTNSNTNTNTNTNKLHNNIEYYKNKFLIKNEKINDNFMLLYLKNELYDFVVYNHYQNNILNKVCISIFPFILNTKYEISNIKFLSFSLTINNINIDILLKNDAYNYYIVNNIINKTFIYYYLMYINMDKNKQIQEIFEESKIDLNTIKYKIVLMDNNVNVINLDEKSEIIIKKNEYLINNKEKVEEDEDFIIT